MTTNSDHKAPHWYDRQLQLLDVRAAYKQFHHLQPTDPREAYYNLGHQLQPLDHRAL